jgi:O-antigen biosynthesis protein
MYKCDIIMPIYHNAKMTIEAIDSLYAHTDKIDWRLIAIIDGYDIDLINYFKDHKDIDVIYHKYSKGFVDSTNAGLLKVRKNAQFVLLLNNDILIKDNLWLKKMCDCFDEDTGAVGGVSDYVMGLQKDIFKDLPDVHYTKLLIGFNMLIRKDVFDMIGRLDTRFGMGGNDDLDLSIRIQLCGYKLKICRTSFVHHIGSQSLSKACNVTDLETKTRTWLNYKWGKHIVDGLFNVTNNFLLTGSD